MDVHTDNNHPKPSSKSLLKVLGAKLAEVLLSLIMAATFFFGLIAIGCEQVHGCQDAKGLGISVFAFLVASVVWAILLSLFHARPAGSRLRVGVIVVSVVLTAAVWIVPWIMQ